MRKPIPLGAYATEVEARLAHNFAATILAHPHTPRPEDLYRLDPADLPDERRQGEIFDEVLNQVARQTAHQRN